MQRLQLKARPVVERVSRVVQQAAVIQRADTNSSQSGAALATSGGGTVRAFRIEGETKSDKQDAGLKRHIPGEALKKALAELETTVTLTEPQRDYVKTSWPDVSKLDPKAKSFDRDLKTYDRAHQFKKNPPMKPSEILAKIVAAQRMLLAEIDAAAVFGSRLQIDGSHFIPGTAHSGWVTGMSESGINFSVGTEEHAKYFASTFEGKAILIEFALDKAKWREWKTMRSGPQKAGIGPSASYKAITLNDVDQAGVKYEVMPNECAKFFKEVVATHVKATVKPIAKGGGLTTEDVQLSIARLDRICQKLAREIAPLTDTATKEMDQLKSSQSLRETFDAGKIATTATAGYSAMSEMYRAISLTKNALHSVRRQTTREST